MSKAGPRTGPGSGPPAGTKAKPRASEPAPATKRPLGVAGGQRKASGPVNGQAKFYSGPTVPAPSAATKENVKQALNEAGGKVVQGAKASSKSVSRTVRRHPYSILSILTALPALLFFSLFSTVLCPPPSAQASWLSRQTHSILGLPSAHPMRDTLCYPAYTYREHVLEPHVYPLLARAQEKVEGHPIYVESVLPAYGFASNGLAKAWEGPIKPVVNRIQKGVKRIYLTFIQPHLPYLRAQWYTLTAPYVARVQSAYTTHADPHVRTAQKYGLAGAQAVRKGYADASEHRVTRQVQRLAKEVQRRAGQAWVYAKPRLVRGARVAERRWREQARPALIRGAKGGLERLDRGTAVARAQIAQQYQTHLAPTLSPYIARAQTAISPYTALFLQQIYNPYIRPTVEYYFPPPAKPLPPRSFWQMVSDFLPAAGLHAAEQKGSMYDNAKASVREGKKDAKVVASSAKASAVSASKAAKASVDAASAAASKQAAQAAKAGKIASAGAAKKAARATEAARESASSVQAQAKASASSISKGVESAGAAAVDSASSVTKEVKTAVSSASQAVQSAGKVVEAKAESVVSAATDKVQSVASQATDSASSVYSQATSAGSVGTASVESAASAIANDASASVDSASKAVESGTDAGKRSAQSVAEQATRVAGDATASIKDAGAKVSASVAAAGQMTRAEMERVVGGLIRRLEGAGEAAEKELVASIVNTYQTFHDETFPKMHSTNKGELSKDIDYVLGGLDKLYSRSTALTAGQIEMSGQQAEARVQKKYQAVRQRGKEVKRVIGDMSRPYLIQGEEGVEGGMKRDLDELEGRVDKMDGVTAADRARIADLKKRVQERKDTLRAIHEGKKSDKAITTASSKLSAAINELSTELDDLFEAFREQVKLYQRVALSKVSARDVVQASPASGSGINKDGKDGKASILPIVPKPQPPAADVVGAGEAVIGKGEAQVMDALSDLLSSAANRQTQVGAAERVMSSAKSAQSASAGTGTPRRAGETSSRSAAAAAMSATDKVRRAGEAAAGTASSVSSAVTDQVKEATKSAGSAAAGISDTVKSVAAAATDEGQDAMESVKSVMSAASASVGSAAAGGTAKTKGVGSAAGRVGEDAAGVAEAAMAHDEL